VCGLQRFQVPVQLPFNSPSGTGSGADGVTHILPASRLSFIGDYCKRTVAHKAVNDGNVGRTARNVVIPIRFPAKSTCFRPTFAPMPLATAIALIAKLHEAAGWPALYNTGLIPIYRVKQVSRLDASTAGHCSLCSTADRRF
jgi:hypothetical protein